MKKTLVDRVRRGGMFLPIALFIIQMAFGIACAKEKWQPVIGSDESLAELLTEMKEQHNQPAMAAALVHGDDIIAKAVVGKLVSGEEQTADENSRFHIGSTTKSMTALLLVMLVKEEKLAYDMTLEQALPDMPMRDEYRKVTIHDLLCNKAGIIAFQQTQFEDPEIVKRIWMDIPVKYPDPTEQRHEVTKLALSLEPIAEPGTKVIYSNVGWPIIGYILEQAAGKAYEDLLYERIFNPLGMNTTKLGGWPASESDPNQPRGHYPNQKSPDKPIPQKLNDQYVLPAWMNPSGGVHCSILDYARYVRENLLGLQGKGKLLGQKEYEIIHSVQITANISEMYMGSKEDREAKFGYGWGIVEKEEGNLSAAAGSGGTFFAQIYIYPALNLAFAGFTNCGSGAQPLKETYQKATGLD